MSDKFLVAEIDEIPPGSRKVVKAGAIDVAIFNIEGNFHAIKDSCPHLGESLARGSLDGTAITCPGHSWIFDIKSGRCLKGDEDISLKTFEVSIEDGKLYLEG